MSILRKSFERRRQWIQDHMRLAGIFGIDVLAVWFLAATRFVVPEVTVQTVQPQLILHVNSQEKLPQQVLLVEERLGSVYFYLRPDLRANLTKDQIAFAEFDLPPTGTRSPKALKSPSPTESKPASKNRSPCPCSSE